jgi:hypothetical protein
MQSFCVLPALHNRKYLLGLRICLLTVHRKFSVKTKCPARVKKAALPAYSAICGLDTSIVNPGTANGHGT